MSEEPPSWWAKTFETESRADDLSVRVQCLEFQLREEQRQAGDARKEAVALSGRIGRLKGALDFAVAAAAVPIAVLVMESLWRRYSGWDLAAIWGAAGFAMTYVAHALGRRINSI